MSLHKTNRGQALVEYILVVAFLLTITLQLVRGFTGFMTNTLGNLGHVLSYNLSVGVCESECFYSSYKNGFRR